MPERIRVMALMSAVVGGYIGWMCAAALQQHYEFFSFLLTFGFPSTGTYIGYTFAVLAFWLFRRD